MKLVALLAVTLVLLGMETALLRPFGLSVARADVCVVAVLFIALRCNILEGALGAAVAGYFVDVLSGQPSGLPIFTSVFIFWLARLVAPFVEAKKALPFAALAVPIDLAYNFTVWGLSLIGTAQGNRLAMLKALPLTAILTAGVALLMWPLLRKVDSLFEKPDTGLLR
jgi:rod shape-determining protein MreD